MTERDFSNRVASSGPEMSGAHGLFGHSRWRGLKPEVADVFAALGRKATARDWAVRVATLLLPLTFLCAVLIQPWYDTRLMFLDTITAAEFSDACCRPFFGFVSNTGIFLWVATASICLFSAFLLLAKRIGDWRLLFTLSTGIFTGWLALDDAFLIHERVLPSVGVDQNVVLASYFIVFALYFFLNRRATLRFDIWLLALGIGGFALSLLIDIVFHSVESAFVSLEDSAKFVAIFCWFSFHVTCCGKLIVGLLVATTQDDTADPERSSAG